MRNICISLLLSPQQYIPQSREEFEEDSNTLCIERLSTPLQSELYLEFRWNTRFYLANIIGDILFCFNSLANDNSTLSTLTPHSNRREPVETWWESYYRILLFSSTRDYSPSMSPFNYLGSTEEQEDYNVHTTTHKQNSKTFRQTNKST